jgi:hypothetical protein
MKKQQFIILFVLFSCLLSNAQPKSKITVLYLLPFHLKESFDYNLSLKNSEEINQIRQFEMIGFWLGAKMALTEYAHSNKKINVIVRDAVTDQKALNTILNDKDLMDPVELIIGPFYGSLFPIVAEFAKNNCITIVNPFSTRYDFVENNPYVYKIVPPFISRPKALVDTFLSNHEEYTITLCWDSTPTQELLAYRYYFNEHKIPFKETHILNVPQNSSKKNLIVALFDQPERVIHGVHTLINREDESEIIPNYTLIVPEKWIYMSELTDDFFKLPNLYYFTNCFVNENNTVVKEFQYEYLNNYEAPATLKDYSYQGYDVTRYFIDLFFADFDFTKVTFTPLSYLFQWKQISEGGFENTKVRLINVHNLELFER